MPDQVRLRLRELVRAHAQLAPLEHLRQLREEGLVLRESTFYRLYGAEWAAFPVELKVRFEGLPGEFARFDFGQTEVELLDGRKGRVHFAAYRLKDSRWPYLQIVPDERVESLIRALLNAFEQSGGVPLRVVFENPKTVVLRRDDQGRPVWNETLAQVAIDFGFTVELCAPRSPQQKGSVESLVGWGQKRFFRGRRFVDLDHDLPAQPGDWLSHVIHERPSRATGQTTAYSGEAVQQFRRKSSTRSGAFRPLIPTQVVQSERSDAGVVGCPPIRRVC